MASGKKHPGALSVQVPDKLATPEFMAAWSDWLTHILESGKRPTSIYARDMLCTLANSEPYQAVAAIRKAVSLCRTYIDMADAYGAPKPKNTTTKDSTRSILHG